MKRSRSPISERYQKALRLGVRFKDKRFLLLDGSPLPELFEGAVRELVIAPEHILNGRDRLALVQEIKLPLLGKDTEIYLGMSRNAVPGSIPEGLIYPRYLQIPTEYLLTKVILLQNLHLCLRGDQKAWLDECKCDIPAISEKAESLNHAFTLASIRFETGRRQHTANVFNRAWTKIGARWQRLDELRINAIEQHLGSQSNEPVQGERLSTSTKKG